MYAPLSRNVFCIYGALQIKIVIIIIIRGTHTISDSRVEDLLSWYKMYTIITVQFIIYYNINNFIIIVYIVLFNRQHFTYII